MGSPRVHVWSQRIQKQNPLFLVFEFLFQKLMYGLNAHVWWAQREKRINIKEEGNHSARKGGSFQVSYFEIIVLNKVVGPQYFWTTTLFFCNMISEWRGTPPFCKQERSLYKEKEGSLFILKSSCEKRWLVFSTLKLYPLLLQYDVRMKRDPTPPPYFKKDVLCTVESLQAPYFAL